MSDKTYFSKINDGLGDRYVKDAEVREYIEDIYGYKTFKDNEFIYRNSGGDNDIETGLASIERIKGNTVAWNQLVLKPHIDSSNDIPTYVKNNVPGVSVTYSNGYVNAVNTTSTGYSSVIIYVGNIIVGHKYYVYSCISPVESSTVKFRIGSVDGTPFVATEKKYYGDIITAAGTGNMTISFTNTQNGEVNFNNSIAIDLTLIYGAGNEPSTEAQFEADYERWFGKPFAYEEYDEGSLRPVLMQSVKTTGFNQWDEEYGQNKQWNVNTGVLEPSSTECIYNLNPISVLPNTTYYVKIGNNSAQVYSRFYDKNMTYLGSGLANQTFTTTANAVFMNFHTYGYGNTYNHDICINISNPSKDGTYEPYKEKVQRFDVTAIRGKLDGAGESVTIFPDGLKKAGNIQDEIFVENGVVKAIKRVGSVDLGSLTWVKRTGDDGVFQTDQPTLYYLCEPYVSLRCGRYTYVGTISDGDSMFGVNDKSLSVYYLPQVSTRMLYIKDASYTDAATFKTAMNGVMLYYELATPQTYVLDNNPLIDYYVNKYGTEEILSLPNAVSPILNINYPVKSSDSLHTLPKDYISGKSINNFLNVLSTETKKTWSRVWNLATLCYEFSVKNSYNGHDYVEIGGLKWATMNVGANSITDTGLYFQWGDTQGYTVDQIGSGEGQKYFGWADYKYGNGTSSPGSTGMTKYNSTDGKTVLDIEDDAVRANWGGAWRMPTTDELQALGAAVNTAWTANYNGSGIAGLVCTDKTDSSKELFFPAVGYCGNGSVHYVGNEGYYWSSSLYTAGLEAAFYLDFYDGGAYWGRSNDRCDGLAVRGVFN